MILLNQLFLVNQKLTMYPIHKQINQMTQLKWRAYTLTVIAL